MLQYIVCFSVLLHQYAQAMSPVRPIIADIRPCPMYKCAVYCEQGYIKDKRGCTTCKCIHYPRSPLMGRCPRNSKSNIDCPPMLSHDDCSVDKDCPGRKKCCTFGCSKKCINPRYSRSIWLY